MRGMGDRIGSEGLISSEFGRLANAAVSSSELFLVFVLVVTVLLQLDAFLWIYTGGQYTLNESLSAGAHIYSIARELMLIALLAYLVLRRSLLRLIGQSWPMATLAGYFLLSAAWSDYPVDSLRGLMVFAVQIVVGFVCCVGQDNNAPLNRLKLVAIWFVTINVLFFAAFPSLATGSVGYLQGYQGSLRGVLSNKNSLGASMALCVTPILAATIREGRMRFSASLVTALVVCLGLVALSQSASGVAACVIAFVVYVVQLGCVRPAPAVMRVGIVGLMLAATLCGVVFAGELGDLIASVLGRDPTFSGRTFLWDYAVKMADLKPTFGYGFAGFWQSHFGSGSDLIKIGLWEVNEAHNGFIESYLFGGVVGLVLTIGVFAYLLGKSLFALVQRPGDPRTFFALCVTLQILAQNFSESHFPNQMDLAGTLLTVAMIVLQTAPQSRTSPPRQNPGWRSERTPLDGSRGALMFDGAEVHNDSVEVR